MNRFRIIVILTFFFALILRLSLVTLAHHGDLNNNISWGTIAYEKGLKNFYEGYNTPDNENAEKLPVRENGEVAWPYSAPNQPPLTIEMFAVARLIWQKVRDFLWYMNWTLLIFPSKTVWFWDDKGMDLMVKLPSIFADLGIALLIYLFALRFFKKSKKTAFISSAIWLFNPVTWYNSAVWGQTDPVVNLLGLTAVYFLLLKNLTLFAVVFTLSLLFKGSLTIFVPILAYWAVTQKFKAKNWIKAIAFSLLTVAVVSIWFHPGIDLFVWLFKLYKDRILPGEIGYLTANAFNFWWLVNPGKILDNTMFFGLTARLWGFIFSGFGLVIFLRWLSQKPNKSRMLFALGLSSLVTFLFLTRIHERYLYPFFPTGTIGLSFFPAFWPVYVVLSLTFLINQFNLFWVPTLTGLRNLLGNLWFTHLLSLVNIAMLLVCFRMFVSGHKRYKL